MYTLRELIEIDAWVNEGELGPRARDEETGLTLKDPEEGGSHSYVLLRRLAHEVCGAHYHTPQYNQRLLIYWLNHFSELDIAVENGTYSAPHNQLNFATSRGKVSIVTDGNISKQDFFAAFSGFADNGTLEQELLNSEQYEAMRGIKPEKPWYQFW